MAINVWLELAKYIIENTWPEVDQTHFTQWDGTQGKLPVQAHLHTGPFSLHPSLPTQGGLCLHREARISPANLAVIRLEYRLLSKHSTAMQVAAVCKQRHWLCGFPGEVYQRGLLGTKLILPTPNSMAPLYRPIWVLLAPTQGLSLLLCFCVGQRRSEWEPVTL